MQLHVPRLRQEPHPFQSEEEVSAKIFEPTCIVIPRLVEVHRVVDLSQNDSPSAVPPIHIAKHSECERIRHRLDGV